MSAVALSWPHRDASAIFDSQGKKVADGNREIELVGFAIAPRRDGLGRPHPLRRNLPMDTDTLSAAERRSPHTQPGPTSFDRPDPAMTLNPLVRPKGSHLIEPNAKWMSWFQRW